ncbi:monovalent cation/H(+) antiporter subunit G [Streptomyces hoynatensis]|uniref:Sodium:proton antiporter n=1 Tax=Streptomyces hoynatensis TaxID=1141874 RepID=A0A3A9Z3T8_9ACTN|nr:monovalent cation/H(+) antiporter subunit G [Streptomyces hoynatensis]RKN42474.1 sodium:proton antiporter [Streptomyces hoynatensis]
MRAALEAASAALLLAGAAFCLLSGVGLVRFRDTVSRLHAASKVQTLGLLLTVVGASLTAPATEIPSLLLLAVFSLLTAPVTGHVVGRVAYRTEAADRAGLHPDELARRLAPGPDRSP